MRKKLFTVEDTFQIEGRGLEIVGKDNKGSTIKIKPGDMLIIVKPNKEEIRTKFIGFSMFSPPNFEVLATSFPNLTMEDIPIGSEVFVDK